MKRDILDQLLDARNHRKAVAVVTRLEDGAQRLVSRDDCAADPMADDLADGFRFDKSRVANHQDVEYFIDIHNPPLKMIIIGAVHIAQAVTPIAAATGFDVIVIDPRGAFATDARFPGVTLHADWPDEVLGESDIDVRTAVLALTHDPKVDDPALAMALKADPFYIGALGSRRTHASRLERLEAQGFSEQDLGRINGPIGLDIGARGQAEIAVAIMAQVVQHLRLGGAAG